MKQIAYYGFVIIAIAAWFYIVGSAADRAIARQDLICQEGC